MRVKTRAPLALIHVEYDGLGRREATLEGCFNIFRDSLGSSCMYQREVLERQVTRDKAAKPMPHMVFGVLFCLYKTEKFKLMIIIIQNPNRWTGDQTAKGK